jgi:hypothetical protein
MNRMSDEFAATYYTDRAEIDRHVNAARSLLSEPALPLTQSFMNIAKRVLVAVGVMRADR